MIFMNQNICTGQNTKADTFDLLDKICNITMDLYSVSNFLYYLYENSLVTNIRSINFSIFQSLAL